MEVDKGIKLEEQETGNCFSCGVGVKREHEECIGCFDLQDKIKKANDKCALLELDIGKKETVIDRLEFKVGFRELENIEFLDEFIKLKQRNEVLQKSIRDSEEMEKFARLMIENEALVCEKRKAESDLESWKLKCKEMEVRVMELANELAIGTTKVVLDLQEMCSGKMNHRGGSLSGFNVEGGHPSAVEATTEDGANHDGSKGDQTCIVKSRVKKCLDFTVDRSPLQKHSPSTLLGYRPPLEPIGDSDDDLDIEHVSLPDVDCNKKRRAQRSCGVALESEDGVESPLKNMHKPTAEHQSDEETSCSTPGQPFRMHKRSKVRKGFAQIVTSESESDDNIPLSRLAHRPYTRLRRRFVNDSCFGNNLRKVTPRRRLLRVGDIKDNSVSGKCSQRRSGNQGDLGISENMNDTLLEDEMEEDESSSEGGSSGGFNVDSTDVSDSDDGSNCNDMSDQDGSFSGDCSDKSECDTGEGQPWRVYKRGQRGVVFEQRKDELADADRAA
ncbi:hypothetical protein AAHA92_13534 [Salvia divinorum]|uniref:Uncharacterized protein n=1 Tax=Salvia divinorum TaxID=28513 RepID=A0ABD1H8M1_SALDI